MLNLLLQPNARSSVTEGLIQTVKKLLVSLNIAQGPAQCVLQTWHI